MRITILNLATLVVLGALTALNPAEASNGNVGPLSGVWEIQGTPDANPCGVAPFLNVASITRDGIITNVDPLVGIAVGEAYRLKKRKFAAGFFGFINDNGAILRYEVQGTLKLINAGQLAGKFRATLFDPTNTPFCTYEGTISGARLVAVPY